MREFMVVVKSSAGYAWAQFFDGYASARTYAMATQCGIGVFWQIYQWEDGSYKLLDFDNLSVRDIEYCDNEARALDEI